MKLAKIFVFNTKEKMVKMIVLTLANILLNTPFVLFSNINTYECEYTCETIINIAAFLEIKRRHMIIRLNIKW